MSEAPPDQVPKVLPPHYFFAGLVLIVLLGFLTDPLIEGPGMLPHGLRFVGLLPFLAGGFIAAAAASQFAQAGTNIVPLTESSALVTDKLFRFSRNPMYLGMLLMTLGTVLIVNQAAGWLVLIAFFVVLRQRFVLREEAKMEATFGEAYRAYKARVRRWL